MKAFPQHSRTQCVVSSEYEQEMKDISSWHVRTTQKQWLSALGHTRRGWEAEISGLFFIIPV